MTGRSALSLPGREHTPWDSAPSTARAGLPEAARVPQTRHVLRFGWRGLRSKDPKGENAPLILPRPRVLDRPPRVSGGVCACIGVWALLPLGGLRRADAGTHLPVCTFLWGVCVCAFFRPCSLSGSFKARFRHQPADTGPVHTVSRSPHRRLTHCTQSPSRPGPDSQGLADGSPRCLSLLRSFPATTQFHGSPGLQPSRRCSLCSATPPAQTTKASPALMTGTGGPPHRAARALARGRLRRRPEKARSSSPTFPTQPSCDDTSASISICCKTMLKGVLVSEPCGSRPPRAGVRQVACSL